MAFSHGSKATLSINGTDVTAYLTSISLSREADTAETTTLGKTSKTYIPGLKDGSFSIEGLDDAALDAVLSAALGAQVPFVYRPAGTGAGKIEYTGNAIGTSYEPASDVGEAGTCSAEFQVTGDITRTVQV